MRTLRGWLTIGAAMLVCACASSGSGATRAREDRNALTGENLAGYVGRTLLDVVQRERPHWLGNMGPSATQSEAIVVYQDGTRMGGPAFLRDIYVDNVASVRFLTGPEAASRFGLNHQSGAILVTTRK